jgi:UDP-N-acetylglucosamine acyltransferase
LKIHPTAIIEPGAVIGNNCVIGPFCHIGPEVVLGDDCVVASHVVISGATTIGPEAKIYSHAVLGGDPQNTGHRGGHTTLTVGRNCLIREGVTMNRGTDTSRGNTKVGDYCMFLAYSHVAHDCQVGDYVTMANTAGIAGHCEVGDRAILGGGCAIHQFCRIGNNAFVGGLAAVAHDVIPYGTVIGNHAYLAGLNIIGMKRAGIARAEIHAMRHAVKMLFDPRHMMKENISRMSGEFENSIVVRQLLDFVSVEGKRAYCTPPRSVSAHDDPIDE